MTVKEAARQLNISVRTLQRYTKEGRISARQERGKTRSVLVYDEADIVALRITLEQSPYARQKRPTLDTNTVTIRLDAHTLTHLGEAGAKQGLSAGQYARELIINGLEARPGGGMERLRRDLANSTFAILAFAGTLTPEQAEKWVRENILQE